MKGIKNKSGVYVITCVSDNKIYVGSAADVSSRLDGHLSLLRGNKHPNRHLQNAFNLYGEENFRFELLEYCELSNCILREQNYLDTLLFAQEYIQSNKKDKRFKRLGFNIRPIAESNRGIKMPNDEESKKRRSERISGVKHPMFGKKHKEYSKQKMSESAKGRIIKPETIEKIRQSKTGVVFTENHRLNIGKEKLGVKNPNYGKAIPQTVKDKVFKTKFIDNAKNQSKVELNNNKVKDINKSSTYVTSKYRSVIATDVETGEEFEFISLRRSAFAFGVSKEVIDHRITNRLMFKGFYFKYK